MDGILPFSLFVPNQVLMSEKYKSTDVQDLLPDKILVFSKLFQFFFDICYPLVDVLSFLLNVFQLNVVFQFASPDLQKPQFPTQYSDQFSSDMEHIPWDTINLMESVDEKLDAFNDLFLAGLDNHAPIKTVKLRRKPNPAITPEIKELIMKRNQLHAKARKTGSGMDWDAFVRLRRDIKHSIRQAERDYFNEQVTVNKGKSGCIWKTIRRALPNTSTQCHQYTKDTSTLANEFNRFFVSVGENAANKSEQLAK